MTLTYLPKTPSSQGQTLETPCPQQLRICLMGLLSSSLLLTYSCWHCIGNKDITIVNKQQHNKHKQNNNDYYYYNKRVQILLNFILNTKDC